MVSIRRFVEAIGQQTAKLQHKVKSLGSFEIRSDVHDPFFHTENISRAGGGSMKNQRFLLPLLVSGLLLRFFASGAEAQRLTGTIRGTVSDETEAVLPGVTVEIESPALIGGVQSTDTSASGVYHFPALAPGTYTAILSMQGFRTIRREGIVVTIGQTITVDIVMALSTVEETVTVIGESPVVDLTKSGTTTNYSGDLLESLQELQKVLHSRPKRTLGMLLKELRKLAKLDNESECLLSKGIDKRNEIVHRFFYKHWVAMITPVGRNVMLDDLKGSIAIIRDTYELSDKIRKQLDALMKSDTDNSDEVR